METSRRRLAVNPLIICLSYMQRPHERRGPLSGMIMSVRRRDCNSFEGGCRLHFCSDKTVWRS